MQLRPAPLEDWLRDNYFTAEIDISSSGVQPYSMSDVRSLTGLTHDELDRLVFDDGYSLGTPAVRAEIAKRWGGGDPDKVMTTSGSGEAISLVLMSLLRPGDEVVVVQPGYHLLIELAVGLGCTVRTWHLDVDRDWQPSIDEGLELITERTRAVIVNFPQNPTGVSITEEDLLRLVDRARQVGAYLLWDAAFAELTYETDPLPDVSTVYERGIGFGTFSKVFGLAGLRFGWCLAPPEVLRDCVRIRDYTTLHVAPLIELVALRVLQHAEAFIEPRHQQARTNREILRRWARANEGLVSLALPTGGVAAFPRLEGVSDVDAFCDRLFKEQGVLVIPGSCFGAPQHIRLGFGGQADQLVEGLDRLATALTAATSR
ncbi:capreomycidine synthase [Streptosporangium subroseum]|uniref:capreomycidine synthase n=1 Tax=Streptosporangium subroseum TaxID=106412 RepID=UPI00344530CF